METDGFVVVGRRFNGPVDSANGGYAAGILGRTLGGPAEVTLRTPPPLETPLKILRADTAAILTLAEVPDDGTAIAEARTTEPPDVTPPLLPDVDAADRAAARHPGLGIRHPLSDCVVCGPERPDGFRLHSGPLDDAPEVGAAVFRPDPSLAKADGTLPDEVLWAALDCPSFTPAMWTRFLGASTLTLLGRLTVALDRPVAATETLVAVGWPLGDDGRKHYTAAALVTPSGDVVGRSKATWITLRD